MTISVPDPTSRALYRHWTQVTIRYADLDPNNHVNNRAINQYFADGRVSLRQQHLCDLPSGVLTGFALVKFTATYRSTLHFPGTVEVGTAVTRIGRTSYELSQGIFQGDTCAATAEVVTVHLNQDRSGSSPLPMPVRTLLEALLVDASR